MPPSPLKSTRSWLVLIMPIRVSHHLKNSPLLIEALPYLRQPQGVSCTEILNLGNVKFLAIGGRKPKGRDPDLTKDEVPVSYVVLSSHIYMVGDKLCADYQDSGENPPDDRPVERQQIYTTISKEPQSEHVLFEQNMVKVKALSLLIKTFLETAIF